MRSPAFSLLVGMVFSIEICPLEPVSVIADELTSSLRLDKIGIAFLEAINRAPAIFEDTFLLFQLGTTPMTGIGAGNYAYIILTILVGVSTFYSLRNNAMSTQSGESMQMMNIQSG